MKTDSVKFWQVCSLILGIITIVLIICMVMILKGGTKEEQSLADTNHEEDGFREIMLSEDLMADGKVKNLDNVRWNHARIMQDTRKIEVSIDLNNESKTEKVEARPVTVELLDKSGKTIAKKDAQMPEITDNYGYVYLEVEFDMTEPQIIYDVRITALEPKVQEKNETVETPKAEE